jgi:Ca2+-transporting ATPase
VDGQQLEEDGLAVLGDRVDIFSRISPAHKLQVVQALQGTGQVVGVTGDGINDAPALRAAQVGIAMGKSGSAAARAVADVVLQDDDLATMVTAISQGRTIYRNIRQTVHFLLATNLSEIIVMLVAVTLGLGAPLNALQLLWLNLVTDIFPGLALALEPPAADVLCSPPRDPSEPIIPRSSFWRIALEAAVLATSALLAYGYGLHQYSQGPQATTLGFMGLTLAQVLHALSCRSPGPALFRRPPLPPNPYLGLALSMALGLQLCSAVLPGLHQRLQIAPLNGVDAAVIGVAALLPLFLNELSKGPWRSPGPPSPLPAAEINGV